MDELASEMASVLVRSTILDWRWITLSVCRAHVRRGFWSREKEIHFMFEIAVGN